jgi:hypothetical protein
MSDRWNFVWRDSGSNPLSRISAGSLADLDPIELGEAGSLFLTRPRLADHLPV